MSRITPKNLASSMKQAASQAKQASTQAQKLYEPGKGGAARTLAEKRVSVGPRVDVQRDGFEQHAMAGAKTRVYGETSLMGGALGGDAFVGGRNETATTARNGDSHLEQTKLGAEVGAAVYGGTEWGAKVAAQAGVDVRVKDTTREQLGGGFAAKQERGAHLFQGAQAHAQAQLGYVSGAAVGVFAGVRAGVEGREALVHNGNELVGVGGKGEVLLGVGVEAQVGGGFDVEKQQAHVKVGAGAALGIGAAASGEVTVGGYDRNERPNRD